MRECSSISFTAYHQIDEQLKYSTKLYLWTEKGALLHAKSLNNDKAWEVYDWLEFLFKFDTIFAYPIENDAKHKVQNFIMI